MADDETPLEAWERQEDELDGVWVLFQSYRDEDLPRSLQRLADRHGKNKPHVGRHSKKHNWKQRVAAWDREQDRIERQADMKERATAVKLHARKSMQLMKTLLLPAEFLVKRIEKRLAEDPDVDPFETMSDLDLLREARMAARTYAQVGVFNRLSLDLSTSNVGGHSGGAVEVDVRENRERVERMPRDEMDAYLLGVDAGRTAEKNAAAPVDED